MSRRRRFAIGALACAASVLLLSACGSSGADESPEPDGLISVVASTDVYGDIVESIAGDRADVQAIITDPSQDPHSFEGDTRTQLALSRADLVIENGGGYDDFVDTLLKASKSKATVLNAVDISGYGKTDGDELNEHVWYDMPAMKALVSAVAGELSTLDPNGASAFAANARKLTGELAGIEAAQNDVAAQHADESVAITEPVPLYMIEACGLTNRTPAGFSESVENDTDASARDVSAMLALFTQRSVSALVYNDQTAGPQTQQVLDAARAAGIPAIAVTETLPDGQHYVQWMTGNLEALRKALGA